MRAPPGLQHGAEEKSPSARMMRECTGFAHVTLTTGTLATHSVTHHLTDDADSLPLHDRAPSVVFGFGGLRW